MRISFQIISEVLLAVLLFILLSTARSEELPGTTIEKEADILYLPDILEKGSRYPLIVAFSAGANA